DWSSDVCSSDLPVVEPVVIAHWAVSITVVLCEGVQTRTVHFEIPTAVILVGPVLRDNLNLRAAEASVFRVVVVCEDFDFLNGIFIRCDDGGAAPGDADGVDTVNRVIILAGSRAIGGDLPAVFNLKCSIRAGGPPNRGPRQIIAAVYGAALCPVSKRTRCKLKQLKRITAKRRQFLKAVSFHRPL